ncbi:hypothetical protein LEP1GSC060_3071 [Leptospira weilii serovar Ranarum str. ICFT]|uniref:Uncharacterized protein n=1 Tax=Leptospira weilii serovar Ranarum str. ICFT TaxID=1218598 RepID=N1WEZ2_9LEPT|nr:hypothetical protein LEP1GSC060_3071 [Leptospira weilii serovar Ranarum str. ICFT]
MALVYILLEKQIFYYKNLTLCNSNSFFFKPKSIDFYDFLDTFFLKNVIYTGWLTLPIYDIASDSLCFRSFVIRNIHICF